MLDMSWGEVMVIGGVALIVIGPKDLPKALRTVGQMTSKVRRMASEFQSQFNEAMREAELEDVKKEVEGLNRQVASAASTSFNPIQTIRDELKGAVETTKPAYSASGAPEWSSNTIEPSSAPVVEENGPTHHLEPTPQPAADPVLPPLPPVGEMPGDLTGPGLEPSLEAPPLKSRTA